jgi:hypothetical protein
MPDNLSNLYYMKQNFRYLLVFTCCLLIFGCKKAEQNSGTEIKQSSIIGVWEVKLLTISTLDSSNTVIKTDTAIYTDEYGNPATLLEEYTQENKLFMFTNTTSDTNKLCTFTLTGKNLKINLPDTILPFNNRTISKIDNNSLEVFQIISTGSLKQKWIQSYLRK